MMSLERVATACFLGLTAFFAVDVHKMSQTGQWILINGSGRFAEWPQPGATFLSLSLHAAGMILWMFAVVHQLETKGRVRRHVWVGYLSAPIMLASLLMAGPAIEQTPVPALHAALGLTLPDIVLLLTVIGIGIETVVAIAKARNRQLREHRQHAICAVLFTAAPGLYRMFVYTGLASGRVVRSSDPKYVDADTVALHEWSLCLAILLAMTLLFHPSTSGHLAALSTNTIESHSKKDDDNRIITRPPWQYYIAVVMVIVPVLTLLVLGQFMVDLLHYRFFQQQDSGSVLMAVKPDLPGFRIEYVSA